MSRRGKQFESLRLIERDFSLRLDNATSAAMNDSHSTFFLADEFNPWREMQGRTDETTDQLVEDAHLILKLRRNLGETEDCVAAIFLSYCRAFCDTTNENRYGVQKHARALTEELYKWTRARIDEIEKKALDGT